MSGIDSSAVSVDCHFMVVVWWLLGLLSRRGKKCQGAQVCGYRWERSTGVAGAQWPSESRAL